MIQKVREIYILVIAACLLSGCGKKSQLQYETAQLQAATQEQTVALKAVQAESAAIGNLGQYNYPQQAHIDQLRARIRQLQEEVGSLTTSKASAQKDLELLKQELADYRALHLK